MKLHNSIYGLPVVLMFLLIGCATNDACLDGGTCPDIYMERTDIQLTGEFDIWDNQVAYEVDNVKGPVELGFYGDPSFRFDFDIEMEAGFTFTISMVNNTIPNPWTHVGVGYTAYPGQELGDKVRYVTAELRSGDDVPAYSTNLAGIFPAETVPSAFWIVSSDENQIKCRIKDMTLYHSLDQTNKVEVNGTFIARTNLDEGKDD